MSNLLVLPDEVKIKIFEYLNGVDKIELLKVCQDLERIGTDREVIRCLNFSNNYKTTMLHLNFIARKATCHLILVLNLHNVHWIPSAQLRNTLIKFINLKELYVTDTQLSYFDLTTVLDKTVKVTKVALSLRPDNCADVFRAQISRPLTHLYVTYNSYSIRALVTLLTQFEELEELWIIEPSVPFDVSIVDELDWTTFIEIDKTLPVVLSRLVLCRQYKTIPDKSIFIELLKHEKANWVVLEDYKDTVFTALENMTHSHHLKFDTYNEFEESLRTIKEDLQMRNIFCVDDLRKMMLNKLSYSEMEFTSLNLFKIDPMIYEDKKYRKAFEKILLSKNTRKLHKLRSLSFIFTEFKDVEQEDTQLFKKRRVGIRSLEYDDDSLFAKFTKHASEVEDFEIIDDAMPILASPWQSNSLKYIANWKILKKLTITSNKYKNGKFIIDITKNCTMLSCLKIQDNLMQDHISADLCEALRYARNLKDLRYERKAGIPVDQLFDSLTHCQLLERLYVQCRFASKISKKPLETVIARCENLVFLFLYISELPDAICKSIKQSINEIGLKSQQIICVRGQTYSIRNILYEDIPTTHVQEMVCQTNNFYCDFLHNF